MGGVPADAGVRGRIVAKLLIVKWIQSLKVFLKICD